MGRGWLSALPGGQRRSAGGDLPSVRRRVLTLAWPAVLEQSLLTLVSLVDTYIVGHLGAAPIAAVGLGGQTLMLTNALFVATGVGATALIARSVGARNLREANALARQALLVGFSLGVLAAAGVYWLAPHIFRWLGAEAGVIGLGTGWLRLVSLSFPFISLVLVGGAALRGAGDMRASLMVMTVVNVVNIGLAWSLTRGTFGLPQLGVAGTGIATAVGQTAGGLVVLALLARGRAGLRLGPVDEEVHGAEIEPRRHKGHKEVLGALRAFVVDSSRLLRPDGGRIRRILNIGLPAGAEQLMLQLAILAMSAIVTTFGTAAYAAHVVTIRLSAVSYLPGWGFSVAATTMVGQELGAGRPDRARGAVYSSWHMALSVMTLASVLIFAFPAEILRMFTSDAGVIAAGVPVMRLSALAQPAIAAAFVFSGALRGAGDTRATMVVTIASVWGLRLVLAYVLGTVLRMGLVGVWLAFNGDWLARASLLWLRFRAGRWQTLRV